jgi:hypothetical protein
LSFVRFTAAASLIAFGGIIAVGGLALIPSVAQRVLVAGGEMSRPPAIPCEGQTSLSFDRDCSSVTPQRDLPRIAAYGSPSAVTGEVPTTAEKAPERPSTEPARPAAAPPEPARQAAAAAPPEPPRPAAAPQQPPRQAAITAPERVTPVPPPTAEERRVAKPMVKAQARPPAAKKVASRDQAAKRATSEALRTVRRFGDRDRDTLQDIPVSSYAADGQQRTIVIRPTSVQDVYYYSVRR